MPKATTIDGRSIDEYIPQHLRDMFYKSSYPENTYATTNGYGPYDFSTKGLVLYLPLWALKGSPFKSVDAYKHTCTVVGALWTPEGRTFDGDDDSIHIGMTKTAAGTLECWARFDILSSTKVDDQALFSTLFLIQSSDLFYSSLCTTLNEQSSWIASTPTIDTWYHYVHTWTDKTARTTEKLYIDTVLKTRDNTSLTSREITYLGSRLGTDYDLDGKIGEARIYNRALSAEEVAYNSNTTKWRYK